MPRQIDLTTEKKPVRDFIQNLGILREPIELLLAGRVVAKLVNPTELSDKEKKRKLAENRKIVERARANCAALSASAIERKVQRAVDEIRKRYD